MDSRVEKHMTKNMIHRCGDVIHEFRWAHEKELLEIIKSGRTDRIDEMLRAHKEKHDQTINDVEFSPSNNESDLFRFVSALTLFSRAAIEGGVPELIAYSMQESYVYCARRYHEDFFMDALISFTQIVADHKKGTGESSSRVRTIKTYIMDHLNCPLSLRQIAEQLCLSPSRCAHLFKEETGMSIRSYIERERIKAAKAQLIYSDMDISGISEYLTFSSPSHFSAVFKKHTGMTPKEWRERGHGGEDRPQPPVSSSLAPYIAAVPSLQAE